MANLTYALSALISQTPGATAVARLVLQPAATSATLAAIIVEHDDKSFADAAAGIVNLAD